VEGGTTASIHIQKRRLPAVRSSYEHGKGMLNEKRGAGIKVAEKVVPMEKTTLVFEEKKRERPMILNSRQRCGGQTGREGAEAKKELRKAGGLGFKRREFLQQGKGQGKFGEAQKYKKNSGLEKGGREIDKIINFDQKLGGEKGGKKNKEKPKAKRRGMDSSKWGREWLEKR